MKNFAALIALFAAVPAMADSCKVWIRSEPAPENVDHMSRGVEFESQAKDALNDAYRFTKDFMDSTQQENVVADLNCQESALSVRLQILK